jgi:tetratricopeptide (TPR) repeat protein
MPDAVLDAVLLQQAQACPVTMITASTLEAAAPAVVSLESLIGSEWLGLVASALVADGKQRVMLSESPLPFAPEVWPNATLVAPAERPLKLRAALRLLLFKRLKPALGLRQQPLHELPAFAAAAQPLVDFVRAAIMGSTRSSMSGPDALQPDLSIASHLWMGDGSLSTSVHFDDRDNLLLQMVGRKHIVLFPPEVHDEMGFADCHERRYLRPGSGTAPSGRGRVVNHSPLAVFEEQLRPRLRTGRDDLGDAWLPPSDRVARAAVHCSLAPGQALFIPALWAHAVASTPETIRLPTPEPVEGRLHAAINFWFTRGTHSFDAALREAPTHAPARVCRGSTLAALGRHEEALEDFEAALELPTLPEGLRASTEHLAATTRDTLYRARLRREVTRAGGWTRDVERRVRAEVWPQGEARRRTP